MPFNKDLQVSNVFGIGKTYNSEDMAIILSSFLINLNVIKTWPSIGLNYLLTGMLPRLCQNGPTSACNVALTY